MSVGLVFCSVSVSVNPIRVRPRLSFFRNRGLELDLEYPGDAGSTAASSKGGGGGKVGGKGKKPASRTRKGTSRTRTAAGGAKPALSRGSSVDLPAKGETAATATAAAAAAGSTLGAVAGAGGGSAAVEAVVVAPKRKGAAAAVRKTRATRGGGGSAVAAAAAENKGVAGEEEGVASSGTDRQQASSTARRDRDRSPAKRAAGRPERGADRASAFPRKPSSPLQSPLRPITNYSSEGDRSQQRGAAKVSNKPYVIT